MESDNLNHSSHQHHHHHKPDESEMMKRHTLSSAKRRKQFARFSFMLLSVLAALVAVACVLITIM